jgi:ribonucleotide monophosphatase NagD (HAD superfamily)
LQKNRFWQRADGLSLDVGPFVAALEYATGRQATVVGKPAGVSFGSARHLTRARNANASASPALPETLVHVDHTRVVEPLERTQTSERGEPPETYPTEL